MNRNLVLLRFSLFQYGGMTDDIALFGSCMASMELNLAIHRTKMQSVLEAPLLIVDCPLTAFGDVRWLPQHTIANLTL